MNSQPNHAVHLYETIVRTTRHSPRSPSLDWPVDLQLVVDRPRRGAVIAAQMRNRQSTVH